MMRKSHAGRRQRSFLPKLECCEERVTPSGGMISPLLQDPIGYLARQPNTPVLPFATPAKKATYIDPTVRIGDGLTVVVGYQNFIGPYATLNGRGGAIKIGNQSDILDNARIIAKPAGQAPGSVVKIGDQVVVSFGATIEGPSTVGGYFAAGKPTYIGPGALVDGATIDAGAMVLARARVGPGVTVPGGYKVLPGKNVTTQAEADDPGLGYVAPMTAADVSMISQTLTENAALAVGYTQLYQGDSSTGVNIGANPLLSGIDNGDLAKIRGANIDPGPQYASFEKASTAPQFLTPRRGTVESILSTFPGRLTGTVAIGMRAWRAAHRMGRANAYRADQGQPITIGSIASTGSHVTINSPLGGSLRIGRNFRAGAGSVILSGPNVNAVLGDDVSIGAGAVVDRTSLGSGSVVGPGAYLLDSSFPANTVIPANAIYISNRLLGYVSW